MDSEMNVFDNFGPKHLTTVDWNCPHYRRSIVASLVQGIYALKHDQRQSRSMARTPDWWEFFKFQLRETLYSSRGSIFGGIYEYKHFARFSNDNTLAKVPRYVIAFRGTKTPGDIKLDARIIFNKLHKSHRYDIARVAVKEKVNDVGTSNIWLAGHSLGSAIATLVGRDMAKEGLFLESFLFNPPFVSTPIEWVNNKKIKHVIEIVSDASTSFLAKALRSNSQRSSLDHDFTRLSSWIPNLFVNSKDFISYGYINYFERREMMKNKGLGSIGDVATKHSNRDLLLRYFGKESDPFHLLPSARLHVNRSCTPDVGSWSKQILQKRVAHGISQWWKPDLEDLEPELYQYKKHA